MVKPSSRLRWSIWLVLLSVAVALSIRTHRQDEEQSAPTVKRVLAQPKPSAKRDAPVIAAAQTPAGANNASVRQAHNSSGHDPFAPKTWIVYAPPPAPIAPPPPPAPTVPPLPFRYVGMLQDTKGHWSVQLDRGGQTLIAGKGEIIDDQYRLDDMKDGQLSLTYLPMNARQTLDTTGL